MLVSVFDKDFENTVSERELSRDYIVLYINVHAII